ncbi:MAG: hypothetical protein M1358_17855, partial [Chloroflexi bacterium]|nr:hypothetical protein [Chloroflexota bacterium]
MRLFNDLTLRWKLLVTFGVVLAILGGAGAWTTAQLRQQDASWEALLDGESEGAQLAQEMRVDLLLQVQALKNTWLRGSDPKAFQQYTGEFDANANKLREARSQMASLSSSLTSDESALLQKFDTGWAAYLEAWPRALEAHGGAGGGQVKEADAVMKWEDSDA